MTCRVINPMIKAVLFEVVTGLVAGHVTGQYITHPIHVKMSAHLTMTSPHRKKLAP
jgi:hypothetical protein